MMHPFDARSGSDHKPRRLVNAVMYNPSTQSKQAKPQRSEEITALPVRKTALLITLTGCQGPNCLHVKEKSCVTCIESPEYGAI